MKVCRTCKESKKLIDFPKHSQTKDGRNGKCKTCNAEYWRNWRSNNIEKSRKSVNKYADKNRDKIRLKDKEYRKDPRVKKLRCNNENKRRAKKLNATIPGFDEKIKSIYMNCPKGYEVDHIIPLNSKNVCGLHTPWNLQYLTSEENRKKYNKLVG